MRIHTLFWVVLFCVQSFAQEKFPDGTPIPDWFRNNEIVNIKSLGGKYKISDSTVLQTEKLFTASFIDNQ